MNTKAKAYLIIIIVNILYALFELTHFFEKLRAENALIRKADLLSYCFLSFTVVFILGLELRQKNFARGITLGLVGSFLILTIFKIFTLLRVL